MWRVLGSPERAEGGPSARFALQAIETSRNQRVSIRRWPAGSGGRCFDQVLRQRAAVWTRAWWASGGFLNRSASWKHPAGQDVLGRQRGQVVFGEHTLGGRRNRRLAWRSRARSSAFAYAARIGEMRLPRCGARGSARRRSRGAVGENGSAGRRAWSCEICNQFRPPRSRGSRGGVAMRELMPGFALEENVSIRSLVAGEDHDEVVALVSPSPAAGSRSPSCP